MFGNQEKGGMEGRTDGRKGPELGNGRPFGNCVSDDDDPSIRSARFPPSSIIHLGPGFGKEGDRGRGTNSHHAVDLALMIWKRD